MKETQAFAILIKEGYVASDINLAIDIAKIELNWYESTLDEVLEFCRKKLDKQK